MNDSPIPEGYWRDTAGRLVPVDMVKPIDRARHELVLELVEKARIVSETLARFKAEAFADIAAFVDMSAEQYGVKRGGTKGNVSLLSYDGRYKVSRNVQDHLVFDERLQAAKQLIDECIHSWTEDSRDEIKALINDAFQVSSEGKIHTGRVLGLRRLDISDKKWQRAMQAISDSVLPAGSKSYIRIHERVGDTDQYKQINLDMAGV